MYIIQRLRAARQRSDSVGFDAQFECDYMGSSEFEWGATNRSLKRIREIGDVQIRSEVIVAGEFTREVYFVGPSAELLNVHIEAFKRWIKNFQRPRSLELTFFPDAFAEIMPKHRKGIVAWWDLDEDFAFTLSPEIAEKLKIGFATLPAAVK